MATGKTFTPSMAELTLYAFQLVGLRPSSLLQEHMESARMAANMVLSSWSALGVNLWEVDLQTVPLVEHVERYDVPDDTVVVLDAYVTISNSGKTVDRVIMPISRSEYATYPVKEQLGLPTVFWFNRQLKPEIYLWPTPNGSETSFSYYRMRQIAVTNVNGSENPELPIYFVEAFALALASRLAAIWQPEKAPMLLQAAQAAYADAAAQNVETADYYISPMLAGYYR
jgi:hypothetical protein